MINLTQEQASILCEAFEIDSYMHNQDEIDLMIDNNPELHEAQRALFYAANPNEPENSDDWN